MAVAYNSVASGSALAASSLTYSLNNAAGDGLIVDVTFYDAVGTRAVSGVTYAGAAMTSIGGITVGGFNMRTEQWRLIAPATGANNVVVTMNGTTAEIKSGAVSMTGVHQTTMVGTQATASGSSTTPSVAVTSATDELVMDGIGADTPVSATVGAGQTERWKIVAGVGGAGSSEAGAASVTMSWTLGVSTAWVIAGVSVKASAGDVLQSQILM